MHGSKKSKNFYMFLGQSNAYLQIRLFDKFGLNHDLRHGNKERKKSKTLT